MTIAETGRCMKLQCDDSDLRDIFKKYGMSSEMITK